ncbi:MAG: glucosylceramidase, partial [Saprospiraceae bacterium]|nr:glucosylceramidase [Saprospiraceae bacterium]
VLFEKQSPILFQSSKSDSFPTIEVEVDTQYQQIEGFGYTLTGGSAGLIKQMGSSQQKNLLDDLFLCKDNGKCVSYIRLSMGASDLDEEVFSYNDIDPNSEDLALEQFFDR